MINPAISTCAFLVCVLPNAALATKPFLTCWVVTFATNRYELRSPAVEHPVNWAIQPGRANRPPRFTPIAMPLMAQHAVASPNGSALVHGQDADRFDRGHKRIVHCWTEAERKLFSIYAVGSFEKSSERPVQPI
jgi:hypothetical protein